MDDLCLLGIDRHLCINLQDTLLSKSPRKVPVLEHSRQTFVRSLPRNADAGSPQSSHCGVGQSILVCEVFECDGSLWHTYIGTSSYDANFHPLQEALRVVNRVFHKETWCFAQRQSNH